MAPATRTTSGKLKAPPPSDCSAETQSKKRPHCVQGDLTEEANPTAIPAKETAVHNKDEKNLLAVSKPSDAPSGKKEFIGSAYKSPCVEVYLELAATKEGELDSEATLASPYLLNCAILAQESGYFEHILSDPTSTSGWKTTPIKIPSSYIKSVAAFEAFIEVAYSGRGYSIPKDRQSKGFWDIDPFTPEARNGNPEFIFNTEVYLMGKALHSRSLQRFALINLYRLLPAIGLEVKAALTVHTLFPVIRMVYGNISLPHESIEPSMKSFPGPNLKDWHIEDPDPACVLFILYVNYYYDEVHDGLRGLFTEIPKFACDVLIFRRNSSKSEIRTRVLSGVKEVRKWLDI